MVVDMEGIPSQKMVVVTMMMVVVVVMVVMMMMVTMVMAWESETKSDTTLFNEQCLSPKVSTLHIHSILI